MIKKAKISFLRYIGCINFTNDHTKHGLLQIQALVPLLNFRNLNFMVTWYINSEKYLLAMILALNFVKIILRHIKIGYNTNVIRQTVCMVVSPITVNNFASLFGC